MIGRVFRSGFSLIGRVFRRCRKKKIFLESSKFRGIFFLNFLQSSKLTVEKDFDFLHIRRRSPVVGEPCSFLCYVCDLFWFSYFTIFL